MIPGMDASSRIFEDVRVLPCADCPRVSTATARGWTAYHVSWDAEDGPALVFFCPECSRRRLDD